MIPLILELSEKLSKKLSINGYNPFNFFNIILSGVNGTIFTICILVLAAAREEGYPIEKVIQEALNSGIYLGCILLAIVCFLLLLFRNRKLKSIPKMIIFSIISSAFGIIIAFVALIVVYFSSLIIGGNPERQSGGQSSENSNGQQWTRQYSNQKGEYYSDGQGNFKDQYGNDVYNPQGVSDYDKL